MMEGDRSVMKESMQAWMADQIAQWRIDPSLVPIVDFEVVQ